MCSEYLIPAKLRGFRFFFFFANINKNNCSQQMEMDFFNTYKLQLLQGSFILLLPI